MTLLHEARERVRTDMKRPMGDFNEPQVLRVCRLSFLDEKLAKTPDDRDLEFNFIYLYKLATSSK